MTLFFNSDLKDEVNFTSSLIGGCYPLRTEEDCYDPAVVK